MKKILLHVCCGPCAIYVVKKLQEECDVILFFYNPNIQPEEEFNKRKAEVECWAKKENLDLIISPYKPEEWLKEIHGHEEDKEGGERCHICYRIRIFDTANYASINGYDFFATTLTISPHKKAEIINKIGEEVAEKINEQIDKGIFNGHKVEFLEADWKKHDGFKIACELSDQEGFYRQNYCGCIYSKR